jgi:chromosome segregation ATPase
LFSAFILELTAAVLFLFSATDFFAPEPLSTQQTAQLALVKQYLPDVSNSELESLLSSALQIEASLTAAEAQRAEVESQLQGLSRDIDELNLDLESKNKQIKWLNDELNSRKTDVIRLANLERQFLVRMSELNSKIGLWGTSINFQWQPDEKREIALMLQEAFKEIGYMPSLEIPNDDPMLAHEILVRYQKEKKFKEVGFLTPQVVAFIIQDYLGPLRGDGI